MLFSAFGIAALALAALGLYAVGAYEVAQRKREVGIRLAIGGSASAVEWLIVRQALVPVMIGILVGLAGTYWAAKFIQAFLYQVDARDPATLAGVTFVLMGSTAIAAWLPARRASPCRSFGSSSRAVTPARLRIQRVFAGRRPLDGRAIITSVDLTIAMASSPRRSFSARTASAVITAVSVWLPTRRRT